MQSIRNYGLTLGVALSLAGCVAGTQSDGNEAASPAPAAATKGGEVEAPNVYATTDLGLWDGRPSLGGVWVAATNVKDPEHVIIRNLATGKSVTGALFRRERNNPGPRIQVSSEAAQALGMLAGAPARLSIVALRRATPATPAAATAASAAAPAAAAQAPVAKTAAAKAEVAKTGVAKTGVAKAAPQPTAQKPPATPAPAAATSAATPTSGPLVQLGTYSVEANARAAAAKLGTSGLAAAVQSGSSGKKQMWRVVVAPAPGSDVRALLSKVKGLGFPDAYIVTK